eukprot:FR742528.1.p1 GENE.FR742528.1~~FR742528.1.p1  ORF type:complete len:101 (+),score=70.85 FR742528.1:686-988(+)
MPPHRRGGVVGLWGGFSLSPPDDRGVLDVGGGGKGKHPPLKGGNHGFPQKPGETPGKKTFLPKGPPPTAKNPKKGPGCRGLFFQKPPPPRKKKNQKNFPL